MIRNERKSSSEYAPFEMLFLRVRGRLYQRAYQALHNAADAEDITQEAMVRAWMRLDTFRPDPRRDVEHILGAWLHRIALNILRDFLRHRRRHMTLSLDALLEGNENGEVRCLEFADRSQDPAERLIKSEGSERLHQALERLKP